MFSPAENSYSTNELMSFLGCASMPKHEGTGEQFDDTVNTTKVKAAIANEPSLCPPKSMGKRSMAWFS